MKPSHRSAFVRVVLALGMAAAAWACAAQPVAVLVEAGAGVMLRAGGVAARATVLAPLQPEAELQVPAKARAVLLYLRSGDEYTLDGPATARIGTAQPVPVDGNAPVLRKPAAGTEIRLQPGRLAQGGITMRSASAPPLPAAAEVERRRPPRNAPVAARVAFALWLDENGARAEARPLWRELAAELPDQPALTERAGR